MSDSGSYRLEFGALITELATLNSNVQALTDAMHAILKYSQENRLHEAKVDADKAPAIDKSIGKTEDFIPPSKLTQAGGEERTRYYTRVHSGGRRGPTPPPLEFSEEGQPSKNLHVASDNLEETPAEEGPGGSTSPGSDCALISPPPPKTSKHANTSRKKPATNTRRKPTTKARAEDADNEDAAATDTTATAPTSKKVSNNDNILANLKR
jgi:hypothetical protein